MTTLYNVTIAHPTGGTVTLRTATNVFEESDTGIDLHSGDEFRCFLDFRDNGDIWAEITTGIYVGKFFGVKNKGKVVATWTVIADTPPTTPPTTAFPDYFILESPKGERQRYNKNV